MSLQIHAVLHGESVANVGSHATLCGPETAKGPVLPTPSPPELNQRGTALAEVCSLVSAHFVDGEPRTQGVCLMTESLQDRCVQFPPVRLFEPGQGRYAQTPDPWTRNVPNESAGPWTERQRMPPHAKLIALLGRAAAEYSGLTKRQFVEAALWLEQSGYWQERDNVHDRLQRGQGAPEQKPIPRGESLKAARERGTHTASQWKALVEFCGGMCLNCGESRGVAKDHIQAITRGGSDAIENLQPLCGPCNSEKGTQDWGDLRPGGWREAQP